jgi:hypothetical protein
MITRIACGLACLVALTACNDGDAGQKLAEATAASGRNLEAYSRDITRSVRLGKDAALVQRFCKNATGVACPPDIAEKLKTFGFVDNLSGVDLAYAFVVMLADVKDGTADQSSSDEDFLAAAYRVVVAREPDQAGALSNLKYIKDTGERKSMLRSMLESEEFKRQG